MKKILISAISFLLVVSLLSISIYGEENKYSIPDIYSEYMEEDINNYFLPQGYDLRFDFDYNSVDKQKKFFDEKAVRNESGKIVVPPVVTLCTFDIVGPGPLNLEYLCEVYGYMKSHLSKEYSQSKYNAEIIRTFYLGNESAVRSFVAPWTLYNAETGELYTFPEIMAMSEADLEALDFKTPDFAKFIANVKGELESRGWWKEEYQAKYDILYAHRDDYKNSLDESENFTIDGETYNFATLDYELKTKFNVTENNITCVNIFSKEFKGVYKSVSDEIRGKYSELFEILDKTYTTIPYSDYYAYTNGGALYYSYIIDEIECLDETQKTELKNGKSQYINGYAVSFILFDLMEKYDVSEDDIRSAIDSYNYEVPYFRVFGDKLLDDFFNAETKKEALEIVANDHGIIINVDKHIIMSSDAFTTYQEVISMGYYFDDPDYIISQIKEAVLKDSNYSMESFEKAIDYLESLKTPPKTGDNSILYVIIAAASLTAMSALVFRRKRKVTE